MRSMPRVELLEHDDGGVTLGHVVQEHAREVRDARCEHESVRTEPLLAHLHSEDD